MSDTSNKKDFFEMIRLGLVLVVYAVIACTVLAIVNNLTAPQIKKNQIQKANEAMKEVFSLADQFVSVNDFEPSDNKNITLSDAYLAYKDQKIIGGVIQVEGPTYDKAKIILGIDTNGVVTGMRFLEITDSPGFGSKAKDDNYKVKSGTTFYEQFTGKNAKEGFLTNQTFDAISGATITSDGVAALLTQGSKSLLNYLEKKEVLNNE